MTSQHLTKSRYIAGLQCLRRLWLMVNEPQPYEEPPPGSPMDIGREIGRKAHLLFPGGALIDEEPWQHAQAVARTTALMTDERVPAIFEGAFEFEGIRIRVDVLERLANGTWGLREVKSSTGPKDYHFDDIALQLYVLKGAGVARLLNRTLHVNYRLRARTGRRQLAGILCSGRRERRCRAEACRVAGSPSRHARMSRQVELPYAEPGGHAAHPTTASFGTDARRTNPTDWIAYLPRLSQASVSQLKALGIDTISCDTA